MPTGPALVQREVELRALDTAVAAPAASTPALLWIEGVAGAGKSALLEHAAARAVALGVEVVTLRRARDLARLGGRVLAVLDDAERADVALLDALVDLADAPPDGLVALVVAARPVAPVDAPAGLTALRAHPAVRRILPRPLDAAGVGVLVRSTLGAHGATPAADAIAAATGGIPRLVTALVDAARDAGLAPGDVPGWLSLGPPAALEPALRELTGQLTPQARALLEAAALLGPAAPTGDVAALAEAPAPTLLADLSRLAAAGLISGVDAIAVRPPLLGAALGARADDRRRATAVERIGDLDPERAARLLFVLAPAGSARAVAILEAAARDATARAAHDDAAHYLERALREPPEVPARARVLLALGQARAALADDRAGADLAAAVGLQEPGPARVAARAELGHAALYDGRFADALVEFTGALEELGDRDPVQASELLACVAQTALLGGPDVRDAALARVEAHLEGARHARSGADRVMLAILAAHRAMRLLDRPAALDAADRALAAGPPPSAEHGELADHLLIAVLAFADRHEDGLAIIDDVVRRASALGQARRLAVATYTRAQTLYRLGRIGPALADAERAVEIGETGWFAPAAAAVAAAVRLEAGGDAPARDLVSGVLELPAAADAWTRAVFLETRGDCALALGELEAARTAFAACGALHRDVLDAPSPAKSLWRSGLARALHLGGETAAALELLAEEDALARRWGAGTPLGVNACTHGVVLGGDDGVARLERGVAILARTPSRLRLARGLLDLGALRLERGDRLPAREALRAALDVATACGSRRLAAIARERLVAAGGRPRRARTSGAGALTPSERRVVAMAAEGMTNREIADALVVTVKAVRWHLGNAYRKLGVDDRGELGAAIGAGASA